MLLNYLKTTYRSLLRNRAYALINFVGLTLGLGVAIVLFWIVRFEYSFDGYHQNADRLYRIQSTDKFGNLNSHVPQGVIKALKEQVPGVEKAVNVYDWIPSGVQVGQQVFDMKHTFFSPPDFMSMIDVEWVKGSPAQSLSAPYQVVLDEPTAQRFFGGSDPMGKTFRFDNRLDLTVSGIIRKAPTNTDFRFELVMSRETLKKFQEEYNNEDFWFGGDSGHHGYVLLKDGVSPQNVEAALNQIFQPRKEQSLYSSFGLLPIAESHFDTKASLFTYEMPKWMLYALMSISVFLVVIACINFINLATVQAVQRSREIAVRKVLGSNRWQLMKQFFGETALLVFTGIGAGSLLANQLVRYADQLLTTEVAQSAIWQGSTIVFLALLGLVVTFLAGFYPALVLSGFEPVRVFRSRLFPSRSKGITLRSSLVVTQFVIAQVLVICTLLGIRQIRYFYSKNLGFDQTAVVRVDMPERDNVVLQERFRQQLLQQSAIKEVTFGLASPSGQKGFWWRNIGHRNFPNGEEKFRLQYVDTNYFSFFRIPLIAGRTLTPTDTTNQIVVNEKAVRDMGIREPERALGQQLDFWGKPVTIVGVVKDYHSQSLKADIPPHLYQYDNGMFQMASIRIDPSRASDALQHIEQHWKAAFPNNIFESVFLDKDIRGFYENERKLTNFLTLFAVVGIFIGCLGLFGLVSFVVTQRTKEIGVRKVLGATVASIVSLLSKDFLRLVFVAFAIATPIAYYAMHQFLREYTYKIDIEWQVFALAGVLAALVALLTVSAQSIKAALMNPVKSLRTE